MLRRPQFLRKLKADHSAAIAESAQDAQEHLSILGRAGAAFLQATERGLDPVQTVFSAVPEDTLRAIVMAVVGAPRAVPRDYLELLAVPFRHQRKPLLAVPHVIALEPVQQRTPALKAFEHIAALALHRQRVTGVSQRVGEQTVIAPLGHLSERWRRHTLHGNTIQPAYYEAAACDALRAELRSGEVAVASRRRYRAFGHYLLPRARWRELKATNETGLALDGNVRGYLDAQEHAIHEALQHLQRDLDQIPGLKLDKHGQLHLSRLEPAVPPAAVKLSRRLYRRPVRSEDVIYNANCIRVEIGFFCRRTKLKSGVGAILRQASAANYPCCCPRGGAHATTPRSTCPSLIVLSQAFSDKVRHEPASGRQLCEIFR